MAEQADVYVKNNLGQSIGAARYLPGGSSDLELSISSETQEKIFLPEPGVSVVISPPNGDGTSSYPFEVEADEGLVEWTTASDHWTVQLRENSLPPDTPTTVNVTVGSDGP